MTILKKLTFFLILYFITNINTIAFENKILFKVDNEILTSLDIYNEIKYIAALNDDFKSLDEEKMFEIAKNSLIKEKIKKLEVKKYYKEIILDENFLSKIINSNYSRININNYKELVMHLKRNDVDFKNLKEKISIEILWNELIFSKYGSKVKINREELENKIKNLEKEGGKSYLLSEIVFNLNETETLETYFKKIENSIKEIGFKNTALTYSLSDSAKVGGNIGWIDYNLLNSQIKNEINKIKKGEYTKPILTAGGFIILKIDDERNILNNINFEEEMNKLIKIETNQQLNQFSNIYFNKVRKDIAINAT